MDKAGVAMTSEGAASDVWVGPPPSALQNVPMDGLCAIFDARSGQTHIVTAPVPEILALMGTTPMDHAAILDALCAQYDLEDTPDVALSLVARLTEMAELGLIKRTT
jgi:PqqD family protein of HPr-rel-A system